MNQRDLLRLAGTAVGENAAEPYKGLKFLKVETEVAQARYNIEEFPIVRG
jgi:hypothetical protein